MRFLIEKEEKRRKPFTIKRNAGNVERGIEMFNNSTNTGTLGGVSQGQGMGESLTEGAMKDLYMDIQDAGGVDAYLEKERKHLDRLQRQLDTTPEYDKNISKRNAIQKEIAKVKAKISVADPYSKVNNQRTIDANNKDIERLKLQLRQDDNNYGFKDWKTYVQRQIDRLEAENKSFENR